MKVIASTQRPAQAQANSRRNVLLAVPALSLAMASPSFASGGLKTCASDDAACRTRDLINERAKGTESYSQAISEGGKIVNRLKNAGAFQTNVPVAELNDTYSKETIALITTIGVYLDAADPYSPERINAIKTLKTDGSKWVSKYARGGSARTFSARECYIVVDEVLGHIASNGLAALPARKATKVREDIEKTLQFLAEKR